jgi:serine/threonine protein phosphatase 1
MFERIDADLRGHRARHAIEVYLGDYVDRGPQSRAVIDLLIERARHRDTVFLKGNHETFVMDFVEQPDVLRSWRQFGGLETLMSYGMRPSMNPSDTELGELSTALRTTLPDSHYEFFRSLVPYFSLGDFYFVHAGVKPGIPLAEQSEQDLLWIRDEFLLFEERYEKMIVHGHTPVREPEFQPNRINIDTGAYATGRLTCLMIEHDGLVVL